ncbi:MAG: 50S ribosomal protein L15 [Fidelibacterota bacterium]
MKLGHLKPPKGAVKNTKRVGRGTGSGWGRSSGRGDKGYHSRSGSKHRPWFEGGQMPLHRRLPKRGFSNFLFRKYFQIVNLADIEKLGVEAIDSTVLKEKGLIRNAFQPVKILGDGELTKAVKVTANAFSTGAREKIEASGGKVIEQ